MKQHAYCDKCKKKINDVEVAQSAIAHCWFVTAYCHGEVDVLPISAVEYMKQKRLTFFAKEEENASEKADR